MRRRSVISKVFGGRLEGNTCRGIRKDGEDCQGEPSEPGNLCWNHREQYYWDDDELEEWLGIKEKGEKSASIVKENFDVRASEKHAFIEVNKVKSRSYSETNQYNLLEDNRIHFLLIFGSIFYFYLSTQALYSPGEVHALISGKICSLMFFFCGLFLLCFSAWCKYNE